MYNWDDIYKKTLKNICESNSSNFDNIVEIEMPEFESELIENENTNFDSLFRQKLDENASEEDKRKFVEYIYNYIGENIYDFLPKDTETQEDSMNEEKIRKLLAKYGAEESEIENFMNDLNDTKEELEEDVADEDYVLNQDTINKLKETQDGINLLIKAPEMAKEELKKAIADYLQK